MITKHLFPILACSLMIGSLNAEGFSEKEHYKKSGILASCFAAIIGLSAWSSRDNMVGRVLKDSAGARMLEDADLFAWLTKIGKENVQAIKLVSGNVEDLYTIDTNLEPFKATTDYKIMLGIAGAVGLYALYAAYKVWASSEKDSKSVA